MLYIEDPDGLRWLQAVEVLAERGACDMVLCLYADSPEDEFPAPFSPSQTGEHLERVTSYPDESEPPCSARERVSPHLLESLRSHIGEFEDWGDSLALYPFREQQWIAAFLPHRRVVLVKDIRLYDFLEAAGIPVVFESPE